MGQILRMLHSSPVEPICAVLPTRLITEENKGESFHLHYRNLRLELSDRELESLCLHLGRSYATFKRGAAPRGVADTPSPDESAYRVLDETVIAARPDVHAIAFHVEVNAPGIVHIHLRNVRVELSYREFCDLAGRCRFVWWKAYGFLVAWKLRNWI